VGKVLILRKNKHLFICKKYYVIVYEYESKLKQSINIHCIKITAYRNFERFWNELENSLPDEYDTFSDIIRLASLYHMNICGSYSHPDEYLLKIDKNRSVEIC